MPCAGPWCPLAQAALWRAPVPGRGPCRNRPSASAPLPSDTPVEPVLRSDGTLRPQVRAGSDGLPSFDPCSSRKRGVLSPPRARYGAIRGDPESPIRTAPCRASRTWSLSVHLRAISGATRISARQIIRSGEYAFPLQGGGAVQSSRPSAVRAEEAVVMALPTQTDMFGIVLKYMGDGEKRSRKQVRNLAAERLGLTSGELAEATSSGVPVYESRVGWAISYLNRAKLLDRVSRGVYRICGRLDRVFLRGQAP